MNSSSVSVSRYGRHCLSSVGTFTESALLNHTATSPVLVKKRDDAESNCSVTVGLK